MGTKWFKLKLQKLQLELKQLAQALAEKSVHTQWDDEWAQFPKLNTDSDMCGR